MYIWSGVRIATPVYLDTARLGQMCRQAQAADRDFARLAREEGCTLYFERFLRRGYSILSRAVRRQFDGISDWSGLVSLKNGLQRLIGLPASRRVLLANRSAQLVQLAAQLLCRRCENILVTDMVWPAYLKILAAECQRTDRTITTVPVRQAIFYDRVSQKELIRDLARHYRDRNCDGLFLSAVTYDGVRLPVRQVCQAIGTVHRPRFVVVDGAQALNHTWLGLNRNYCDFLVSGSHKWLRAYHPMGFGFCCRRESEDLIVRRCHQMVARRELDDPLLSFTEQLTSGALESFSETVNVAPMFTATAAAAAAWRPMRSRVDELAAQLENADRLADATSHTGWRLLRPAPALRSGILLLQAESQETRKAPAERIRSAFRQAGVALTAYCGGIIRTSVLHRPLASSQVDRIRRALRQCA